MGYSHSWVRPRTIDAGRFQAVVRDIRRLLPALEARGVRLAGADGTGSAQVDDAAICFNGVEGKADLAHETFWFPRRSTPAVDRQEAVVGVGRNCDADGLRVKHSCKTHGKPYDLAVTAALVIASEHLGPELEVASDGGAAAWREARGLCQRVLGYGLQVESRGRRAS